MPEGILNVSEGLPRAAPLAAGVFAIAVGFLAYRFWKAEQEWEHQEDEITSLGSNSRGNSWKAYKTNGKWPKWNISGSSKGSRGRGGLRRPEQGGPTPPAYTSMLCVVEVILSIRVALAEV